MSTAVRRGLGPGAGKVLADTVRAPRTPPPWSPAAVEGALRTTLEAFEDAAEPWRDAFEGLDEDALTEAATEARGFGADPAAAVDQLVRDLVGWLDQWQRAIGELGRALTAAAQERPLPEWAIGVGRAEDVRWRQARQALLEAVTRHHHGRLPTAPAADRPW
ncbi:hypothetical protein ACIQWA_36795 [Kitasatospora sp. NPDC098652]|uniref:hypothetical protein n=1 Tax=Kitasatospora sp. NPDC098652 TaxID=3364095 RepID=UPI0038280816